MRQAEIVGWGKALPPTALTNEDLERIVDTSDEWIVTRTGIRERRISHVEASDMSVVAARRALAAAGMEPQEIGAIINCTCTPESLLPAGAAYLQKKLGVIGPAAFDMNANCSTFVYGLVVGTDLIRTGTFDSILLVGVEKFSYVTDWSDRTTCVLFGDGAGAVVLKATDEPVGIVASELGNDAEMVEHLYLPSLGTSGVPGPRDPSLAGVRMNGPEVFRRAVTMMADSATLVVEKAGWGIDEVDLLIPHQANLRIIDATARRLKLGPERVFVNVDRYGNTSAATIPIAIAEAVEQGMITPGGKIVFAAFGGGLSWGAAAFKWGERVTPIATTDAEIPEFDGTVFELLAPHLEFFGVGERGKQETEERL